MKYIAVKNIDDFLHYIRIKNNSLPSKMWSDDQLTVESFNKIYHQYEAFLVEEQGEIIGGYLLLDTDYSYWSEKENLDKAYYIHKLFILDRYNGQGYSNKIITHIKNYAKEKKKDYLRLDCRRHTQKLNDLYESLGFQFKREFNSEFSGSMNLREYKIQ